MIAVVSLKGKDAVGDRIVTELEGTVAGEGRKALCPEIVSLTDSVCVQRRESNIRKVAKERLIGGHALLKSDLKGGVVQSLHAELVKSDVAALDGNRVLDIKKEGCGRIRGVLTDQALPAVYEIGRRHAGDSVAPVGLAELHRDHAGLLVDRIALGNAVNEIAVPVKTEQRLEHEAEHRERAVVCILSLRIEIVNGISEIYADLSAAIDRLLITAGCKREHRAAKQHCTQKQTEKFLHFSFLQEPGSIPRTQSIYDIITRPRIFFNS